MVALSEAGIKTFVGLAAAAAGLDILEITETDPGRAWSVSVLVPVEVFVTLAHNEGLAATIPQTTPALETLRSVLTVKETS